MGRLSKAIRRVRNQSYADPQQKQKREQEGLASIWDELKKLKLPTKCGNQICPPGINWASYWSKSSDDYRGYVNLQVFAKGMAPYAGQPPTMSAVIGGMDAVFKFVMTTVPWPPPGGANGEERIDAAAEAALEVANELYESDVVEAALDVLLPQWTKYISVPVMSFAA